MELETQADGRPEDIRGRAARWLEDDEQGAGPPGECRQPGERVGEARGPLEPGWQVDEQEVHRTALEECAGHRQSLVDGGGSDHDQPLEADPAGDGLDGVEGAIEVEVRDDRPGGLGLGDEPERERGPAAREVAGQRETGGPRDATGTEDRVELGEAGRDDRGECTTIGTGAGPSVGERRCDGLEDGGRLECGGRQGGRLVRQRDRRERADDLAERLATGPRGDHPPTLAEAGEGVVDGSGGGHRTTKIEQMFYSVKSFRRSV
jgi:hypothetical protein